MEIEPGLILYRPTERLTSTARFNYEVARTFMRGADIRRNIYIEVLDSKDQIPVSRKPYTLIEEGANGPNEPFEPSWRITIHEGAITDESDSEIQLGRLNRAIKSALSDTLRQEKIGLHRTDNLTWLAVYGFAITKEASWIVNEHPSSEDMLNMVMQLVLLNSFAHLIYGLMYKFGGEPRGNKPWPYLRNNPFEIALPMVPIDKWVWGKYYLAQHGNELIIPKLKDFILVQ